MQKRSKEINRGSGENSLKVMAYKGPIPPPSELEKYKEIYNDAPKIILEMAQNHNKANTIDKIKLLNKAMNFTFLLMFLLLGISVFFFIKKEYIIGSGFAIIPLISLMRILFKKIP